MEMLCPECLTPLVSQDDSIAICPTHGGAFRILYTRYTVASPAPADGSAPAMAIVSEPDSEAAILADAPAERASQPEIEEPAAADISIEETEFTPIPESALDHEDAPQSVVRSASDLQVEVAAEERLDADLPVEVDLPLETAAVIETDDFDVDHLPDPEPQIKTAPVEETLTEFVDQAEAPSKPPSALEAAVESLAEQSPDLDFDEQPFVAEAGAVAAPPPVPTVAPMPAVIAEPAPIAPAIIPAPPPRPVLNRNRTRAQPRSEAPPQRLPPNDPFEVASPSTKPLPAAAFGGGVEIPNPARAGVGTRSKPAARPGRPGVAPKLPPLPPPPPATPVWDGPRPVRQPPTPTVTPPSPNALKPRKLGNCRIHRNVPAIAACRSCGAGVCSACDTLIGDKIHQCPACKAARLDALSAGRRKMARWSIGLALWSAVGLGLLASGATRGFAGTESAFDVAMLILTVVWIFSQIAGLALAFVSYSGKGPNSRAVWIALMLNLLLIAAWVLPFMRLLKLGKE